jgi:hypothetical protein
MIEPDPFQITTSIPTAKSQTIKGEDYRTLRANVTRGFPLFQHGEEMANVSTEETN